MFYFILAPVWLLCGACVLRILNFITFVAFSPLYSNAFENYVQQSYSPFALLPCSVFIIFVIDVASTHTYSKPCLRHCVSCVFFSAILIRFLPAWILYSVLHFALLHARNCWHWDINASAFNIRIKREKCRKYLNIRDAFPWLFGIWPSVIIHSSFKSQKITKCSFLQPSVSFL